MDVKRVLIVVFVVLIPFFLILFSYKIAFHFADYGSEQQKVIDFLEGSELEADMMAEEKSHLEDVNRVMKVFEYIFYSLLLICTLIAAYFTKKENLGKLLLYGGIVTFSLVGVFLVLVFFKFDFLFDLFHRMLFLQGSWLFSADSFLIQTFPIGFFVAMVKKIVYLSLISASIFIGGGIYLRYAEKD